MPDVPELDHVKVNGWMAIGVILFSALLAVIINEVLPFATKHDVDETNKRVDETNGRVGKVEQQVEDLKGVYVELGAINQRLKDMADPTIPYVIPKKHKKGVDPDAFYNHNDPRLVGGNRGRLAVVVPWMRQGAGLSLPGGAVAQGAAHPRLAKQSSGVP